MKEERVAGARAPAHTRDTGTPANSSNGSSPTIRELAETNGGNAFPPAPRHEPRPPPGYGDAPPERDPDEPRRPAPREILLAATRVRHPFSEGSGVQTAQYRVTLLAKDAIEELRRGGPRPAEAVPGVPRVPRAPSASARVHSGLHHAPATARAACHMFAAACARAPATRSTAAP